MATPNSLLVVMFALLCFRVCCTHRVLVFSDEKAGHSIAEVGLRNEDESGRSHPPSAPPCYEPFDPICSGQLVPQGSATIPATANSVPPSSPLPNVDPPTALPPSATQIPPPLPSAATVNSDPPEGALHNSDPPTAVPPSATQIPPPLPSVAYGSPRDVRSHAKEIDRHLN